MIKNVLLIFCFTIPLNFVVAQDVYNETESIVVVEIESHEINSGWTKGTSMLNGKTLNYYTPKVNSLSNPGVGTLSYKIKINNPGVYRFQWHSKVGEGTKATDSNDNWLKFPDASDFYAQKFSESPQTSAAGHIVRAKPNCTGDECPEGSSKDGWMKIYSTGQNNTTQPWKWKSFTSDRDPHRIFAKFDEVGIYTVQISARSKAHFLDRFVLYKESTYSEASATNLDRIETSLVGENPSSTLNTKKLGLSLYPNPTSAELTISGDFNGGLRFEIYGLSGKNNFSGIVNSQTKQIDVSHLSRGVYFINIQTDSSEKQVLKFIKN